MSHSRAPSHAKEVAKIIFDKHVSPGRWWWSSGQRSRLLLRRSEFESRWLLKIVYFCAKKIKISEKEAGAGPFKKRTKPNPSKPNLLELALFKWRLAFDSITLSTLRS